jgi:alcohol dehydrogenase
MTTPLLIHTEAYFENGEFRKLATFVRKKGYSKPAILVDEGFAGTDLFCEVEAKLQSEYGDVYVYRNLGTQEPTYAYLSEVTEEFRSRDFDLLIGIGGGSAMDMAKAVSALRNNPGNPLDYRGFDNLKVAGVPVLLVPTTAGTGSEASYNASFVDEDSSKKMGINGDHMFARYAILDAETTLSCPYKPALSAGVDALVHCLEGFVCNKANPRSDMLAREGIRLLCRSLHCLKEDAQDLNKRLDLLTGAFYGGIVQMNSGSGVAAALSYPLSVYYKVPHGIGGGMFAVDMVRFNIEAGFTKYAELAPLLGVGDIGASNQDNAIAVYDFLQKLWDKLEVPTKLNSFGIGADRFQHVLEIMNTQQPAFDQNPVPFMLADHMHDFLKKFI